MHNVKVLRRNRTRHSSPPARLTDEVGLGALIGCLAGLSFVGMLSGPLAALPYLAVGIVLLCLFAGGVFGLLLWLESAELPEAPVIAPPPGQRRDRR